MRRIAFYLLWVMVFSIPWEASMLWEDGSTVSRMTGYIALGAGLLAVALRGSIRRPTVLHFLLLGFVLYSGLSIVWSVDPMLTLQGAEARLRLFGMVLLVWELASESSHFRSLLRAYVFGSCIAIVGTVQSFLGGQPLHYQRYAEEGVDPNDLALALVVSIPMAWFLASATRKTWVALLYYIYIGAAIFAILLTSSRGGVIAATVSLLIVPLTWVRQKRSRKFIVAALTFTALSAGLKYVPEESLARISTTGADVRQGTLDARRYIWVVGLAKFTDHPIVGVGGSAFRTAVSDDIPDGIVAHNTFLSVLVEYGVVGAGLFLLIVVEIFLLIWHMPRNRRAVWAVSFMALGIGMFALSWLEYKPPWLLISLLLVHASAPCDQPEVRRPERQTFFLPRKDLCAQ
jgi:O-antigen ligase